jgi:Ca2+-binding RTX toxin-like protein
VIYGDDGVDTIFGGSEGDQLFAGSHVGAPDATEDDGGTIWAGAGSDNLSGDNGDDILGGGTGDDVAIGYDGNDIFYMNTGVDQVLGGDGNDTIFGGTGSESVGGGLQGEAGDDMIFGGDGNDVIGGGDGDDHLYAGQGNDSLAGDAGNDTFFFNDATGHNTIDDFVGAGTTGGTEEDLIDLSSFGIEFSDIDLGHMSDGTANANAISITGVDDFDIVLTGVTTTTLTEDDFIL